MSALANVGCHSHKYGKSYLLKDGFFYLKISIGRQLFSISYNK